MSNPTFEEAVTQIEVEVKAVRVWLNQFMGSDEQKRRIQWALERIVAVRAIHAREVAAAVQAEGEKAFKAGAAWSQDKDAALAPCGRHDGQPWWEQEAGHREAREGKNE